MHNLINSYWNYGGHLLKGIKAQLPVISYSKKGPVLIFTSRDNNGRSYGNMANIESLFPLSIKDIHTKIIKNGPPGSYDVAGAMPMQWIDNYLFYIGWTLRKDVPYFNYLSICKFDGKKIEKIGPILSPDIFESGYSGTFHVEKIGDRYLGYYLSVIDWIEDEDGNLNPGYDIKIAESYDLLNWRRLNICAVKRENEEAGISAFSVAKVNGIYHAWFSVRGSKNFRDSASGGYRIEHASSKDGIAWERDKKYMINPGDIEGCEDMAAYPSIYVYNSNLIVLFNGNGFGNNGVYWGYMPINKLK